VKRKRTGAEELQKRARRAAEESQNKKSYERRQKLKSCR